MPCEISQRARLSVTTLTLSPNLSRNIGTLSSIASPLSDGSDAIAALPNQHAMASKATRYANLDILRLFLATNVVVLHCMKTGLAQFLPLVATFVCLSGLLIPDSFTRSTSYGQFAIKRIARVGPGLIISLFIVALLFGFPAMKSTFLYYLTVGVVLPYATSKDPALWSLMLEEILYAGHCLVRKTKFLWRPAYIFVIYAILTFTTLYLYYHPQIHFPGIESYRLPYAFSIASTFVVGNFACLYKPLVKRIPWKIAGIAFVLATAAWLLRWNLGWFYYVFSVHLAALSAIVFGYVTPQIKWKFPDISYGVYVYHTPIIFAIQARSSLDGYALLAVVLPIIIAVSIASWYLAEGPALAYKDRLVQASRTKARATAEELARANT